MTRLIAIVLLGFGGAVIGFLAGRILFDQVWIEVGLALIVGGGGAWWGATMKRPINVVEEIVTDLLARWF